MASDDIVFRPLTADEVDAAYEIEIEGESYAMLLDSIVTRAHLMPRLSFRRGGLSLDHAVRLRSPP